MIHVGIERALAGSLAHSPDGRLPTPPSHGECTAAEPELKTTSAERAENEPRTSALVRRLAALSSPTGCDEGGNESASRKPSTTMQLVIASSDSAAPCSQSASASDTP